MRGRNGYTFLVLKLGGKRPLSRPRSVWKDKIKVRLTEIGWEVMKQIHLAEDRKIWKGGGLRKGQLIWGSIKCRKSSCLAEERLHSTGLCSWLVGGSVD